ncbi:NAD(P)/FAD-dependent oxidoreductase [Bradyrhizobium sp. BTAi1]|uniref:FAD-dependent oxidoreductase n=1 Tax=Bradyrhizobium sp. (strain BTAi1 / ATCC BAA-1182) TaxID=288000 RepID=UPI00005DE6B6|nr:FAD-dependent monooxygenase [Bradyrhizobium sp. BTAi1]ABQ34740.1 putative monooxygenase [Bradyrhizobium sp. BTAi1]
MARQLRIGIIGGGPGGLALAQGLRKAGLDPVVFEKNRARSDYVQGFRLRVRRRGLSALEALLPEALYQAVLDTAGRAPSETLQFDELLRPLDLRQGPDPAADDALIEMSLSRITLRQVLLTGLDDIIAYGRTFASYTENADGSVTAHFEDRSSEVFDVLVGADGAGSRVRAQLLPSARLIDTGARRFAGKVTFAEAERASLARVLQDYNVNIRPTAGRTLMVTSHRVDPATFAAHGLIGANDPSHAGLAGRHFDNTASYVWWNVAFWRDEIAADATLEALDGRGLLELLLRHNANWHPELLKLIEITDPSTVAALKVRSSVPVPPWPTRRVTLLGDAIHSMTYFRALGANSAIHDAGLLVPALVQIAAGAPLIETLAAYEAAMTAHGFAAVTDSLAAMQRALGPNSIAA